MFKKTLVACTTALVAMFSFSPATFANESLAMDLVAVKCNVHKIWSVPSPHNYDGATVVGHGYGKLSAERRAGEFVPFGHSYRHCKAWPASKYPTEGLFMAAR